MAFGEHKAPIIAQAVEGGITSSVAASFLQQHPRAEVYLDSAGQSVIDAFPSSLDVGIH